MSIYESMGDGSREGKPFQRAPTAFVKNVFFTDRRWAAHIHNDQISIVSLPDIPSLFDPEAFGYRMAHFFYYLFQADPPLLYVMQHQWQGMLHQGQARMGFLIRPRLFFCRVRSMVCSNQVQAIIQKSCP